MTEKQAYISLQ